MPFDDVAVAREALRVRAWSPEQVAQAAGGRLVAPAPHADGPRARRSTRATAGPGDLFVGLPGEHVDGGRFAAQALAAARGACWSRPSTPTRSAHRPEP